MVLNSYELRSQQKNISLADNPGYFFVNVDYSLVKITTADIIYIKGLKDYIRIHLKNSQRPVVTRMPMKTIEEQIPAKDSIRVHKSYIVSIAFVTAIRKSSVFIDTLELPVSDNYRDAVTALTGRL